MVLQRNGIGGTSQGEKGRFRRVEGKAILTSPSGDLVYILLKIKGIVAAVDGLVKQKIVGLKDKFCVGGKLNFRDGVHEAREEERPEDGPLENTGCSSTVC